jgi:acetyl-CoA C-acetyltransferase
MREAVIVAASRSPIGRARKGSLAGMRPDDLAVQIVRAALDQVPALDPAEIDDLSLSLARLAASGGPSANPSAGWRYRVPRRLRR